MFKNLNCSRTSTEWRLFIGRSLYPRVTWFDDVKQKYGNGYPFLSVAFSSFRGISVLFFFCESPGTSNTFQNIPDKMSASRKRVPWQSLNNIGFLRKGIFLYRLWKYYIVLIRIGYSKVFFRVPILNGISCKRYEGWLIQNVFTLCLF